MNSTVSKTQSPATGTASDYNHIERVVAVMSGKGGVGKSLVTSLLATGLAQDGYRIGILDADITGPSIPMLFGLHGPVEPGDVGIQPLESKGGVKIISMNLLLASEDQPVIWRGPLIGKAITQLWGDVMWGDLDYLLVDLPPGTADAALTTMRSLPVNGIVMVTTPQCLASMIVRKAVHMAQAIGVLLLAWWKTWLTSSVQRPIYAILSLVPAMPQKLHRLLECLYWHNCPSSLDF
jgi:Mrp family chromosome partitioning ATPase